MWVMCCCSISSSDVVEQRVSSARPSTFSPGLEKRFSKRYF